MKKIYLAVLLTAFSSPVFALSGDTRLACEAILCLSSSHRPNECSPSLDRYFGIKHKKLSDTINARINFLNLCPASNQPNMPSLVTAIANGAGRCDAEYLNRFNTEQYTRQVCRQTGVRNREDDGVTCTTEVVTVISDSKPQYCTAYEHHNFTDLNTRYLGDKFKGGRWYDAKDYDEALKAYQQAQAKAEEAQNINGNRSKFRSRFDSNTTIEYRKAERGLNYSSLFSNDR